MMNTLPLTSYIFMSTYFVIVSAQNEFYCNTQMPETITGVSEGIIKTREIGQEFYGDNLNCVWKLDSGDDKKLIQLTVEVLNLQWSSEYASCKGYDHMEVLNGSTSNSPELVSLCHASNPHSIISLGRYLYVNFSSTTQNFYNHRGIEMTFKLFNKDNCPPGWFQVSPSSPDCLMIGYPGTAKFIWAQKICNLNRGNLASVRSAEEYNTILNYGRNISNSFSPAWIGLSDLVHEGTFAWVDTSSMSFSKSIMERTYSTHCVSVDFTKNSWVAKDCKTELHFVCKALKDGTSKLYKAKPTSAPPEEDNDGTNLFLIVILVVLFVVLIGVGVVIYCYCRKKGRCSRPNSPKPKTTEQRSPSITFSSVETGNAQPSGADAQPSAPPYQDVLLHDPQLVAPPTYEASLYHPIAPANY